MVSWFRSFCKLQPIKAARIVDRPRRCNSGCAFAAVVQVRHRQIMVVRPGSSPGGGFLKEYNQGSCYGVKNRVFADKGVKAI